MVDTAQRSPVRFRAGDHRELTPHEEHPFDHIKVLDRGGSGIVDTVVDSTTGAFYARKVIKAPRRNAHAKQHASHTFHNEVSLIKKLRHHRHVIHVHATYIQDNEFGIILSPIADEGDLSAYLERYCNYYRDQDPESPDLRLEYMTEVLKQAFGCLANGLVAMHQSGVRHKDIKPSNILLHQSSILYTDFGYSTDISHLSHSVSNGQGYLTKRYSAPEGVDKDGRNQFSDVYSLGCVFLEILAALTGSHELSPGDIYSVNMENIHNHLSQMDLPSGMMFIREVVMSMTRNDSTRRPNANTVFQSIVSQPEFCCAACCATVELQVKPREIWVWKVDDYYLEGYDHHGRPTSQRLRQSPMWRSIRRAGGVWRDKTNDVPDHLTNTSFNIRRTPDVTAGSQLLDFSYRTRQGPEATRFWDIGRVCRQRFLEDKNGKTLAPNLEESSSLEVFQRVVRTYIVVQVEQSYVYACPISTYRKKGTLGRDCESSKHTVVYVSGMVPEDCYLPGEREKGLSKEPIEVKPTNPPPTFSSQSRICFFETVRIETGSEAKDVGRVTARQRELLRQYWFSERDNGDGESWG